VLCHHGSIYVVPYQLIHRGLNASSLNNLWIAPTGVSAGLEWSIGQSWPHLWQALLAVAFLSWCQWVVDDATPSAGSAITL